MDGEPSDDPNNLVLRAARALREHAGVRRGAYISLVKRIPARAGLGGGSADCAATLRALNALWKLDLPDEALLSIGLSLGADVPYCLTGGFCRVRGIGECVERLPGGPRAHLALMRLGDGLSTADVFRAWDDTPVFPSMDPAQAAEAVRSGDYDRLRAAARKRADRAGGNASPGDSGENPGIVRLWRAVRADVRQAAPPYTGCFGMAPKPVAPPKCSEKARL